MNAVFLYFWNFIYYFYAGRLVNVFLCMVGTDNLYIHDWDCLLLSRYGNLVSIGKEIVVDVLTGVVVSSASLGVAMYLHFRI